jgi:hypothetical protein
MARPGLGELCLTDKLAVLALCGLYLYLFARPWFEQLAREKAMERADNVVRLKRENLARSSLDF